METEKVKLRLKEKGLKVTPRRLSIIEAIVKINTHPTAEEIIKFIRKHNPDIATATVYKALGVLVRNKLLNKVGTEKDIIRYDAILENHHHLFCSDSDRIEDYRDEELDDMISNYFERKGIPDFKIEDIKLQITGRFTKENK